MRILEKPEIQIVAGVTVVNDSATGSKDRIAQRIVGQSLRENFVFATDPRGASKNAIARACHSHYRNLTLFIAEGDKPGIPPAMDYAQDLGAKVVLVPSPDFTIVSEEAKAYARLQNADFVSFDGQEAVDVIAETAATLNLKPKYVWTASALGGIARGLEQVFTNAVHYTVPVIRLAKSDYGSAIVVPELTSYGQPVTRDLPISCNRDFEAKAFLRMQAWLNLMEAYQGRRLSPADTVMWNPAAL